MGGFKNLIIGTNNRLLSTNMTTVVGSSLRATNASSLILLGRHNSICSESTECDAVLAIAAGTPEFPHDALIVFKNGTVRINGQDVGGEVVRSSVDSSLQWVEIVVLVQLGVCVLCGLIWIACRLLPYGRRKVVIHRKPRSSSRKLKAPQQSTPAPRHRNKSRKALGQFRVKSQTSHQVKPTSTTETES